MSAAAWVTRATGPSSSTTGLADGSLRQADGFVTLNLRAGVYLGRWSVELYGKNLTNERGVTSSASPASCRMARIGLGLDPAPDDRAVGRDEDLGLVAPPCLDSGCRERPLSRPRPGCLAGAARADPPAGFDARVEQIRTAVGVPGLAVAIVEDGKVTLARGYGVRRLGEDAPVDADTIFQLGSVGKAFTTAALAVLVDRGQIAWDDPVTKHIPWFQMYDPWVTREMTVVDLLVHRSGLGLGAGDLMFVPRSTLTRAETVRRLRYIRPATSFRSGYAYDNVLYAVAGQLIEEVSGKTWERFMREDVLVPAGMRTATSDRVERRRTPNRAWPHARRDGPMHGMGTQKPLDDSGQAEFDPELGANAAPAGGVAASANDMGRWIAIQLARGALPEARGACSARRRRARCGRRACTCPSPLRPAPPRRRRRSSTPTPSAGRSGTIAAAGS